MTMTFLAAQDWVGILVTIIIFAAYALSALMQKAAEKRRQAQRQAPARPLLAEAEEKADEWIAPPEDVEEFLRRVLAGRGAPVRPRPAEVPPEGEPAPAVQPAEAQKPRRPRRRRAVVRVELPPEGLAPPGPPPRAPEPPAAVREPVAIRRPVIRVPLLGAAPLEAQHAIVLSEILGAPRSLRPFRPGRAGRVL